MGRREEVWEVATGGCFHGSFEIMEASDESFGRKEVASKDFSLFFPLVQCLRYTLLYPFAALRYFPHVPPLRVTNSLGRVLF